MPYRPRYRNAKRKPRRYRRKYFKKSRRNNPSTAISRTVDFPDRIRTRLVYSERISLTNSAGSVQSAIFSGNGLWDPDVSGVGHQPLAFDQWMTLYKNYRVRASKIQIELLTESATSTTQNCYVVLIPQNSTTAITATQIDWVSELPYSKVRPFNIAKPLTLSNYASVAKILGVQRSQVSTDDKYAGDATSNPTNTFGWGIYMQPADASATTTIYAKVRIIYYAEFYNRLIVAQS